MPPDPKDLGPKKLGPDAHRRSRREKLRSLVVPVGLVLGTLASGTAGLVLFLILLGKSELEGRHGRAPDELCLVIVVDTLRRDALSCYGAAPGSTPAIDALAADGLRFEQAIATSCWTLPSVASLLTGTWPELHKAGGQNARLTPVSPDVALAAELFQSHGFRTIGLANAAFLSPELRIDQGFDVFDHQLAWNRVVRRAKEAASTALNLLDSSGEGRAFLFLHLFDPHLDYDPAPGVAEPFTLSQGRALAAPGARPAADEVERVRALYAREVADVDAAVAALVAALRERGLYEGATIVLTSDHGEEFWEHGGFEHGHAMWDELLRVPLIVKLPAALDLPATVVDEQVRLIDVLPTLLALYGIEAPPSVAGRSLLPLDAIGMRDAFSQDPLYGTDQLSWRTERWHYIHDRGAGVETRGMLFDWRADPTEQHDLAGELPEVAEELYHELASFWNELRARGESNRSLAPLDLSPRAQQQFRESLESLGYVGRDD